MDFLQERDRSKAARPKSTQVRLAQVGAAPAHGSIVIRTRMGGAATPKEVAEAVEQLKAVSRRVKVGKRHGASEVISAERG